MDYTGIMTDVVNTTESFYSNCFGKERLAEIFSMVKLFGDSPEVKGLQAMLDAYGRDGVINQEGVHAYINDLAGTGSMQPKQKTGMNRLFQLRT